MITDDQKDELRRWARATVTKLAEDAVEIRRMPVVKRDEVLTFINALIDRLGGAGERPATIFQRASVRARGGSVPRVPQ